MNDVKQIEAGPSLNQFVSEPSLFNLKCLQVWLTILLYLNTVCAYTQHHDSQIRHISSACIMRWRLPEMKSLRTDEWMQCNNRLKQYSCNLTTFTKIYGLTFWPHPLGQGCVCGQNICYHVAAHVVSFNLICNMTIFWKSLILAWAPPPKSTPGAPTHALIQT